MSIFYTDHFPLSTQLGAQTDRDKPPLNSIISKIAILRKKLASWGCPDNIKFPWKVSDRRLGDQIRNILGIDGNRPYLIDGKTVNEWLGYIKNIISEWQIKEMHLIGSAALSGVNTPFLLCANEQLQSSDRKELEREIKKKKYKFSDVDVKIRVGVDVDLFYFKQSLLLNDSWKIKYYDHNVVIVTVGEGSSQKLDVIVYKKLGSEFAFFSDDLAISINPSDLKKNHVSIHSINPWKWLRGQALCLIENDSVKIDHHLFPRLLGKLLKGEVCTTHLENNLFDCWISKIMEFKASGKKEPLKFLLDKQWEEHESNNVLSRYLLSLRVQQLIIAHNKEIPLLNEAAKVDLKGEIPPFIKFVFNAMKFAGSKIKSVHGAIECIALIALCEGWDHPFQVKLVWHQGELVLRIRFRWGSEKKDLLVKFDPNASLNALNGGDPEQIREILRSLSIEGITQRTMTEDYRKSLAEHGLNAVMAAKLRKRILCTDSPFNGNVLFAQQPSLASLEIKECDDFKQLMNVGHFVFNHYTHDPVHRLQLCWEVVNKCLVQSSSLVNALRKSGEVPRGGYDALFEQVLNLEGDVEIYQACSPFPPIDDEKWILLAKARNAKRSVLAKILDEAKTSGELFLKFIKLSDVERQSISEKMLCRIILSGNGKAAKWVEKMDRLEFLSDKYNNALSHFICEKPFAFDETWIIDYIKSGRFIGTNIIKEQLCKFFLTKSSCVLNKAKFLQLLDIKEPALWHQVANECISQGEVLPDVFKTLPDNNSKTIVTCYEIIEFADPTEILLGKLEKVKSELTDSLKGSILVRLLKNWEMQNDDVRLLEFFDVSKQKIDWRLVRSQTKRAKDLLKALRKGSLRLYTSLFRSLSPTEECYHTWWVEKVSNFFKDKNVEKLVEYLEKPLVMDCLRLVKKKSIPLLEMAVESKRGIELTVDLFDKVSQDHLFKMIKSCMNFDDNCMMASKVYSKYHSILKYKKNDENLHLLDELALRNLMNPIGDIEVVGLIFKFLGDTPQIPNHTIPENLIKLIHTGYDESVNILLSKFNVDVLKSLPPEIYHELLKVAHKIEKKAHILQNCWVVSNQIQEQWEIALDDSYLSLQDAGRLVMRGQILQISEERITELTLKIFRKFSKSSGKFDEDIQQYLSERISKIDIATAHVLWNALSNSNKMQRNSLWVPGFSLLRKEPLACSDAFINWIITNCKGVNITILLGFAALVISNKDNWNQEVLQRLAPLEDWTIKLANEGNDLAKAVCKKFALDFQETSFSSSSEDYTPTLADRYIRYIIEKRFLVWMGLFISCMQILKWINK